MEEKTVAQTTQNGKPSLWDQALRAVKGDSTSQLIEQFTQEMTLVAEGLCEDQARLRKAVDGLIRQAESQHDKSAQDYTELSRQLDQQAQDTEKRLTELTRRVEAIERAGKEKSRGLSLKSGDVISRVTVLAAIVCGTWLIVSILQLFT